METRPFYRRLTSLFKRDSKPLVTPPAEQAGSSHTYKLPDPPKIVRIKRHKRRRFVIQSVSNDPRFNHSLRPGHIARKMARKL